MKKTYISPATEIIVIKGTAILAGSNTVSNDDNGIDFNVGTMGSHDGGASRSMGNFNLWEEIDETNGYVDKQY
jgi:hypothetical protein